MEEWCADVSSEMGWVAGEMVQAEAVGAANMGVVHVSFGRVVGEWESEPFFRDFSWTQLVLFFPLSINISLFDITN